MATTTSTFVRPLMPEVFLPKVEKSYYVDNKLFDMFGQPIDFKGKGDSVRWTVDVGESSSNAAEVSENGVLPDVNDSSQAELSVSLQTYASRGVISDEAIVQGRGSLGNVIQARTDELINVVSTNLISDFESSCAATGSAQGVTVTNYSAGCVSGLEDTDESLTETHLLTALEWLETPSDGGRQAVDRDKIRILCNVDMFYKLSALIKPDTASIYMQSPQTGAFDGGTIYPSGQKMFWNGCEILAHPLCSTGTVILGDFSKIEIYESMPIELVDLYKSNFAKSFAIRWNGALINRRPSAFYKLTNKD